jgi:hypothetical protein
MEDLQRKNEALKTLIIQAFNKAVKEEKTEINFSIADPSTGLTIDLKIKKELSNNLNEQKNEQ